MTLRRLAVSLGLTAALLGCASSAGAPVRLPCASSSSATASPNGTTYRDASPGSPPPPGGSSSTREVTFGGFSLEDHWNQGDARAAIATGRWTVVIMQQGPSALPESQIDLRLWATRFADEARAVGTLPALLTVWPEAYRRPALSDVIISYRSAAEAAGAQLFPAGEAWHAAWDCNARLHCMGRTDSTPALSGHTPPRSSSTGACSRLRSSRCRSAAGSSRRRAACYRQLRLRRSGDRCPRRSAAGASSSARDCRQGDAAELVALLRRQRARTRRGARP